MTVLRTALLLFTLCSLLPLYGQGKFQVRFYHEIKGYQAILYADNEEYTPISSQLTLQLIGMKSKLKSGDTVVLSPRTQRQEITRFNPINKGKTHFHYKTLSNYGDTRIKHYDSLYIYSLPFKQGASYAVGQGYNGTRTHQGIHALDFAMPEKSPVHAAREGRVVFVQDQHTTHCYRPECAKYNNEIVVLHEDGTFAQYSHLYPHSAVVEKGQYIEKGDLLAKSGNTGYSSGPHLHFGVYLHRISGEKVYLPTYFETHSKERTLLEEHKTYRNK